MSTLSIRSFPCCDGLIEGWFDISDQVSNNSDHVSNSNIWASTDIRNDTFKHPDYIHHGIFNIMNNVYEVQFSPNVVQNIQMAMFDAEHYAPCIWKSPSKTIDTFLIHHGEMFISKYPPKTFHHTKEISKSDVKRILRAKRRHRHRSKKTKTKSDNSNWRK